MKKENAREREKERNKHNKRRFHDSHVCDDACCSLMQYRGQIDKHSHMINVINKRKQKRARFRGKRKNKKRKHKKRTRQRIRITKENERIFLCK